MDKLFVFICRTFGAHHAKNAGAPQTLSIQSHYMLGHDITILVVIIIFTKKTNRNRKLYAKYILVKYHTVESPFLLILICDDQ